MSTPLLRLLLAAATLTSVSLYTLCPDWTTSAHTPKPSSAAATSQDNESCAPCAAGPQGGVAHPLDNLATLGRRTQKHPFRPLPRSVFDGAVANFVSTSTGRLTFAVTDLEVSGVRPVPFRRVYAGDLERDAGLGVGWSFTFDDRIQLDGDVATLTTGEGEVLHFRRDGRSQRFVLRVPEPNAHQSFVVADGDIIIERDAGVTRTYRRLGQTYRLSRIADAHGNSITMSFDERGNLTRMAGGSGALNLEWSDGKDARLLAVHDNTGRRVSFRQDGQRLRAAALAGGAQWTYDYQAGKLTRASDPSGRLLLSVKYDRNGRVTEVGDAAGAQTYEYDPGPGAVSPRTVVTDPLGAKTIVEHTARGALAAISDDEGRTTRFEYNAANRVVSMVNWQGEETKFTYDLHNRLLRQSSSSGVEQTFSYDEQGQLSGGDPAGYRIERGTHGLPTLIRSADGQEVAFEYDAAGLETASASPGLGRLEVERDAAGRVTTRRLPSGTIQRFEYDARGNVVRRSDNRGRSITFERDAGGTLTGLVAGDGSWVRAARDGAGRITALTTSTGKTRHFAYDARGALTGYKDAHGKGRSVKYDRRGRLRAIVDDDGNITEIARDGRGRVRLVLVASAKGGWLRYEYDQMGRLIAAKRESGGARFTPAAYASSPVPPAVRSYCVFGGDSWDGFLTESGLGYGGSGGCFDPYGYYWQEDWGASYATESDVHYTDIGYVDEYDYGSYYTTAAIPWHCWRPCATAAAYAAAAAAACTEAPYSEACRTAKDLALIWARYCAICIASRPGGGGGWGGGGAGGGWYVGGGGWYGGGYGGYGYCRPWYPGDTWCQDYGVIVY